MSIADSSKTRVGFITEVAWGTTPATPVFQNLRITGESFNFDAENVVSNELRPDRNIPDLTRVGRSASGGFDMELSYGTFDTIFESVMFGAWATNVLKNGVTGKSFTFEKTFETGVTDQYLRYTGMYANEFSMNCEAGSIITGSFAFVGKGGAVDSAIIAGATYTAAGVAPVLDATSDFGTLTFTGLVGTPKLMSVSLNVTNNLRPQKAIANIELVGVGTGRFELTGTIRAYFEDAELYQAYLDGDELALSFQVGRTAGSKYQVDVPKLKIESAEVVAGGNDQDIMVDLNFRGLYDTTEACTLKITRAI